MKIGQIIRRKVNNKPVGPYMVIQVIEDDRIYADVVGLDNPNVMLLKKDVYEPTISTLMISERVLHCLKAGKTIMVQHRASEKWINAYNKEPELVKFYCQPKTYKATFSVEYVKRFYSPSLREDTIRIVIDKLVI